MVADSIKFSAPGKVILFGEHSVVYGHPAIAAAIGLRALCEVTRSNEETITISAPMLFSDQTFTISEKSIVPTELESFKHILLLLSRSHENGFIPKVELSSSIPPSAGLGSSAATAVSLTASLLEFYGHDHDLETINDIAFESEKITHGSPSGIDNSISTYGGGIIYEKGVITPLTSKIPSSTLVIIDSGIPRQTKKLIEKVQKKKDVEPKNVQTIFNKIEDITLDAKKYLESGNIRQVGNLMNENHELLEKLDVGIPFISNIVDFIDKTDALGRKLTGAGGGGSVIALYDDYEYAKDVVSDFVINGFDAYLTNIFETGVKIEE
ncbi:MAG: mevalonate kinase [Candidatus Heimdallarchaeota archaeon]|nr:mevalonate kinase [Candidatus Heimdallarchaeota archaeon]